MLKAILRLLGIGKEPAPKLGPEVFEAHFKLRPQCGLVSFLTCEHRSHRPKDKTKAECEASLRKGWISKIRDHTSNIQRTMAMAKTWGQDSFRISGKLCDCPHTSDIVGKQLSRAEVLARMQKLPVACLWNFDAS